MKRFKVTSRYEYICFILGALHVSIHSSCFVHRAFVQRMKWRHSSEFPGEEVVGAAANEELAETVEGVAAQAAFLGRLVAGATAVKFELHLVTTQASGGPFQFLHSVK